MTGLIYSLLRKAHLMTPDEKDHIFGEYYRKSGQWPAQPFMGGPVGATHGEATQATSGNSRHLNGHPQRSEAAVDEATDKAGGSAPPLGGPPAESWPAWTDAVRVSLPPGTATASPGVSPAPTTRDHAGAVLDAAVALAVACSAEPASIFERVERAITLARTGKERGKPDRVPVGTDAGAMLQACRDVIEGAGDLHNVVARATRQAESAVLARQLESDI